MSTIYGEPVEGNLEPAYYPERDNSPTYITGHCIALRASCLVKLGLFCETDPGQAHIASERIWCWKASEAKYNMYYLHSPLCLHRSGGPSWNRNVSWLWNFPMSQLWKGRDIL